MATLEAVAAAGTGEALNFLASGDRGLDLVGRMAAAVLQYRPAEPREFLCAALGRLDTDGSDNAFLGAALAERIRSDALFRAVEFESEGTRVSYIARTDRSLRSDPKDPLHAHVNTNMIAQVVWPAAHPLAEWCAGAQGREMLSGKSVIELGSGSGLCGLVAAASARKLTLSDIDTTSVEMCRRSLELPCNSRLCPTEVRYLRWGQRDQAEEVVRAAGGLFDVVIGADIFYISKSLTLGLQTAAWILAPGGTFVCASGVRSDRTEDELESVPEAEGWDLVGGAPTPLRCSTSHDGLPGKKPAEGVLLYMWRRRVS
eukprot:Hpha_TRINITY_DN27588_c0_g1::TRINITY_DN27588_c0_g1_i1::g.86195::m.86195